MPHAAAAFNLARWLTRRDQDAEDVVQEAFIRALRHFDGFRGEEPRAWLLAIVRNTCWSWLRKNRTHELSEQVEGELDVVADAGAGPEQQALQSASQALLRQAIEELPLEFREIVVLRDLEELSYKEISEVAGLPMGTVMSRLSRGRDRLQKAVLKRSAGEK